MTYLRLWVILTITACAQSSYSELVQQGRAMSEPDKLALLSRVGGDLGQYSWSPSDEAVRTRATMFWAWQNRKPIGVCRHISVHLEQLANDIGLKAVAVSGVSANDIGHMYTLVYTSQGIAIVDYGRVLQTNTNDTKEALRVYQEAAGTTTFEHRYFRDAKYEGRIVTNDGKRFLSFIGHRTDSSRLHCATMADHRPTEVTVGHEMSVRVQDRELFLKAGKAGDVEMFELGHEYEDVKLSLFGGSLDGQHFYGFMFDAMSIHRPEEGWGYGRHFSIVEARNMEDGVSLFEDIRLAVEVSYSYGLVRPWLSCQANVFEREIGRADDYAVFMTEYSAGCILTIGAFEIDPYVLRTLEGTEVGCNLAYRREWLTVQARIDEDVEVSAVAKLDKYDVGVSYRDELATLTLGFNW